MSLILISAAALIVYAGTNNSNSSQDYTQLYILDTNGGTITYPLNYTLGTQQPVIVGITNHQSKSMQYNLVLTQNNNSSSEQLYSKQIVLPDNSTWRNVINIKPTAIGEFKMEFSLFTSSNSSVRREVYLWANVTKITPYKVYACTCTDVIPQARFMMQSTVHNLQRFMLKELALFAPLSVSAHQPLSLRKRLFKPR